MEAYRILVDQVGGGSGGLRSRFLEENDVDVILTEDGNFLMGSDEPTTTKEPTVCCEALTAECLACSENKTVDEYCGENPDTEGCPEMRVCCEALTAECMACSQSMSADEYCSSDEFSKNPECSNRNTGGKSPNTSSMFTSMIILLSIALLQSM